MIHAAMQHAMRSPLQSAMDRIGSAVWTPATLFAASEQGVWYDPSDFSTMFQDSAGTTPVTAVGQPVGRILDKSGRGNHATQATAAARPVLQQDGNGKYYLAFDGVDDGMATAAINFTATDKMSVFAGATMSASGGTICVLGATFGAGGEFVMYAGAAAANKFSYGASGTSFLYAHSTITTVPRTAVLSGLADISAPSTVLRENASNVFTNNNTLGTGNFSNQAINIGISTPGNFLLNGRIYSLIVRGALSDAAQIAAVEAYVAGKTGVTL